MPLPTLPPELLFIIRELALPEPPFADYSQYLERNGILRRFATVHSSWLEFARRQLARHVFVYFFRIDRPSIAHQRRMIDNLSTALKSDAFRFYKTLSLVINGRCRAAMEWIDDGRWSEIQFLECAELQDGMLRKFPFLTTVKVEQLVEHEGDGSTPRLRHLRRLIVSGKNSILSGSSPLWDSPTLAHISLDTSLGPRLTPLHLSPARFESIALSNHWMEQSWIEIFPSLPKINTLRHLSLALDDSLTAQHLFIAARGLKLKTLHVTTSFISEATTTPSLSVQVKNVGEELAKAVRGKSVYLEVERVIIYGKSGSEGLGLDEEIIRALEWRTDSDRPPFEDFDGSG